MPVQLLTESIIPDDQQYSLDITEAASFIRSSDEPTMQVLAIALQQIQSAINLIETVLRAPLPVADNITIPRADGSLGVTISGESMIITTPNFTISLGGGLVTVASGSESATLAVSGTGGQLRLVNAAGTQTVTADASGNGTVNVNDGYYNNGNRMVGLRAGGWGLPTGTLSRTTFDPATATALKIAQTLAALITDLHVSGSGPNGHGLLGT